MKIGSISKSSIAPLAPATYFAVCTGIIYIGEQYSERFKKYSNQVLFIWQFPTEQIEMEGELKPRQISKLFTVSAGKKAALRACMSTWNGIQYDDTTFRNVEIFDQIGKECMITTVLSDSGEYANVASVVPVIKGFQKPDYHFDPLIFDVDNFSQEQFESLPEWIRRKVESSTQYQKAHPPTDTVDFPPAIPSTDEGVPF